VIAPRSVCARPPLVTAVALGFAVGPGCLVGDVDGVPCNDDQQCATGAFCDLDSNVCRDDVDDRGGPNVQVTAIELAGEAVAAPFIAPDTTTTLTMVVKNVGGFVADDVTLRMGELVCMALDVDEAMVPSRLAPDEEARVDFTVTPHLCSMLSIQDWFFSFSQRGSRGTFNIIVERAPPSAD
jgi:hypothetical protein